MTKSWGPQPVWTGNAAAALSPCPQSHLAVRHDEAPWVCAFWKATALQRLHKRKEETSPAPSSGPFPFVSLPGPAASCPPQASAPGLQCHHQHLLPGACTSPGPPHPSKRWTLHRGQSCPSGLLSCPPRGSGSRSTTHSAATRASPGTAPQSHPSLSCSLVWGHLHVGYLRIQQPAVTNGNLTQHQCAEGGHRDRTSLLEDRRQTPGSPAPTVTGLAPRPRPGPALWGSCPSPWQWKDIPLRCPHWGTFPECPSWGPRDWGLGGRVTTGFFLPGGVWLASLLPGMPRGLACGL